jgi:hypothetical protein
VRETVSALCGRCRGLEGIVLTKVSEDRNILGNNMLNLFILN